jgi:formate dehydrogenase gamma subunit
MAETTRRYIRFALPDRVEHILLLASFTTLAVTGLVQKFAEAGISQAVIAALGGIEGTRTIHHVAAVILLLESIFHLGAISYKILVRRTRLDMLPGLADVRNAWRAFLYNLGLRGDRPQEGRYNFAEKAEYWAVVWGTVVMAITGFMMWNPISTTRFLPGQIVPAAKAAHGFEAILAVLAILVWHLYHVHLRQFNKSMFTGKMTEKEMIEEHPLELADIKAGLAVRPVDPLALKRRRRVFFPIYAVVAIVLLVGVYAFVSYEQTAITTLPEPIDVPVYVPLPATPFPTRPPTATPAPTPTAAPLPTGGAPAAPTAEAELSWDADIGPLLAAQCGACHGSFGGLNLSTYAGALAGGVSGPAVVPGDPEASILVQRQQAGGHPGQLSPEDLALVVEWIKAGALEN